MSSTLAKLNISILPPLLVLRPLSSFSFSCYPTPHLLGKLLILHLPLFVKPFLTSLPTQPPPCSTGFCTYLVTESAESHTCLSILLQSQFHEGRQCLFFFKLCFRMILDLQKYYEDSIVQRIPIYPVSCC